VSNPAAPVHPALPAPLRVPLAVVSVLGAIGTVVLAIVFAGQDVPSAFDRWMLAVIEPTVPVPKATFTPAWFVSTAGDPPFAAVFVLVLGIVCWRTGRRRLAALTVAATIVNGIFSTVLKPVIGRTINDGHTSYPSGHTAWLTGMGIVVGLLLADHLRAGRVAGLALVLGLALAGGLVMGWAQTGTIVHYATDTIGGFGLALALVPGTAWLVDRFLFKEAPDGPRTL